MERPVPQVLRSGTARAALAAGLGALAVSMVQFRHGIVHLLDTVTYWSGARAVADGEWFTTNLAPAFSNFEAGEFLARGGRLPFVDFPIGYPLVAGLLGAVIGVRGAMRLLVTLALVAWAVLLVAADDRAREARWRAVATAGFGVLVVSLPATRLVTQGALSEPLFCATVLGLVVALVRHRRGGAWWTVVALVVASSLFRFIGAPLAAVAAREHHMRHGAPGRAVGWGAAMMAPAAANIGLAALGGGGHNAGWRGLDRLDLEVFVRSIGGWFDSRQGDLRRTYFTGEGPAWWAWLVAAAWLALLAWTVWCWLARRHRLPASSEMALVCAAVVTSGLVLGMLGFDALVIADNRLMLPTGLLTLAALWWWAPIRATSSVVLAAWAAVAVAPWNVAESFRSYEGPLPMSAAAIESGADVVITDNADGVHWDTGVPAAYAPLPTKQLTGEAVDVERLYGALPCQLLEANGVVVLSPDSTFFGADIGLLDREVERGRLALAANETAVVYSPTVIACD
ncbi:MAG: hypothetical protein ACKOD2_17910 [Ilumatobacteraceae bacterium]